MSKAPVLQLFLSRLARTLSPVRSVRFVRKFFPIDRRVQKRITTAYGSVDLYLYFPIRREGYSPLCVNVHGGGFVMNSALHDDDECRMLCHNLKAVVLNIDYTLAPEVRYPTQLEQCYGAIRWAIAHQRQLEIDPEHLILGGHSAGANLAVAITMLAAQRGTFKVNYLVAVCPFLDLATDPAKKITVDNRFKAIPNEAARYFTACYLNPTDNPRNPFISPVFASDRQLLLLPPTLIITAGSDNLWPEGEHFAKRLKLLGKEVHYRHFKQVSHSFIWLADHSASKERKLAWGFILRNLQKKLARKAKGIGG